MRAALHRSAGFLATWFEAARPLLQNSSILLFERMWGIGLAFIVYMALARTYGPDILGQYSYVQTVMLFAVPFLAVASEGIIVRDFVRQPKDTKEILGSSLIVLSATGLVTTLVPLISLWLFRGNEHALMTMALFTALGFVPSGFLVIEHLLKKQQRVMTIFFVRGGSAIFGTLLKLYLIYFGYPIETVVLATALEAFLMTALFLLVVAKEYPPRTWSFSAPLARRIFKQSLPGMIASVMVLAFYRTNHLLLAYLSDFNSVGQYALAFQTAQMFLVLPTVAFGAVYPKLVEIHISDPARYRNAMNLLYFGFTAAGFLIALAAYVGAKPFFHLVFGDRFDVASDILIVLAVGNIFNFSTTVRGRAIDIANLTTYHMWCGGLGFLLVVISSWLVIPVYGPVGAAWCITGAIAVSGVFSTYFLPGLRPDGIAQLKALLLIPDVK